MVRCQPHGLWNISGPLTPSLPASQLSHAGSSRVRCERFLLRSTDQRCAWPLPCPVPGWWPSSWACQTPIRAQGPASPGALRNIQPCSWGWAARGQEELLEAGLPPPPGEPPQAPRDPLCLFSRPGLGWSSRSTRVSLPNPLQTASGSCGQRGQRDPGAWILAEVGLQALGFRLRPPHSLVTAGGGCGRRYPGSGATSAVCYRQVCGA